MMSSKTIKKIKTRTTDSTHTKKLAESSVPSWVPLESALLPQTWGGKASGLASLLSHGHPVPQGVALNVSVFFEALEVNGLLKDWKNLCFYLGQKSLSEQASADMQASLNHLRQRFSAPTFVSQLLPRVTEVIAFLGEGPLAVRSSAVGEDSFSHSCAGQLESVINVTGADAVARAVVQVWASVFADCCVEYQRSRAHVLKGVGVVIQHFVPAKVSGVAFSHDPSGQNPGHFLFECCVGLGEDLVSGRIVPHALHVNRDTFSCHSKGALSLESLAHSAGLAQAPLQKAIESLAATMIGLENHWQVPLDCEWCIGEKGEIFFLQARPSTTGNMRATLWTNANMVENYPEAVSPLLYSIAADAYTAYFTNLGRDFGLSTRELETLALPLQHMVGAHGGKLYYNLTNVHGCFMSLPLGKLFRASWDGFIGVGGGTHKTAPDSAASRWRILRLLAFFSLLSLALRVFLSTVVVFVRVEARVGRFEMRVLQFARHCQQLTCSTPSPAAAHQAFKQFLRIRLHDWRDAALGDATSMLASGALKALLSRLVPRELQDDTYHTCLQGVEAISGEQLVAFDALAQAIRAHSKLAALFAQEGPELIYREVMTDESFAEFRHAFAEYLTNWGFRASQELMLTKSDFIDEPTSLVSLLKGLVKVPTVPPRILAQRQVAERKRKTRALIASWLRRGLMLNPRYLFGACLLLPLIALTHRGIRARERARLRQAQLYATLRRLVLAIGVGLQTRGLAHTPTDVFLFTHQELDAILGQSFFWSGETKRFLHDRKALQTHLAAQNFPETVCARDLRIETPPDTPNMNSAHGVGLVLKGLAASPGRVSGPAAVVSSVHHAGDLCKGDILVTAQTDPGWAPLFPLLGGLVIERGGTLSHGAIVAREFGIPAVVGAAGALAFISQGDALCVDGFAGTVQKDLG